MNWTVAAAAGVGGFGGAAIRGAIRAALGWRRNRRELASLRARLAETLASPERWKTTVMPPGEPVPMSQPGDHMAKLPADDRWTSVEQEPPQ